MTFIEGHSISCHETTHDFAQGCRTGSQEEMEMVGDQRPCVALRLSLFQDNGQTIQKGFSVLVVPEDFTAFNSPGHYMLQKAGSIKSSLARHDYLVRIDPQITQITRITPQYDRGRNGGRWCLVTLFPSLNTLMISRIPSPERFFCWLT